jgi:prevent-host-death family protein
MKAIGVRELRQRASEFIAEVEAGETITITLHGRGVAMLVPLRESGRRHRLAAQGRLIPARGDLLDLGAPPAALPTAPPASQQLRKARSHER